jgi:exodeoxyribonuclease VII small subunit
MRNQVHTMAQAAKSRSSKDEGPQPNTVDQFETSLSELEALIGQMESGSMSLDDSVKGFERGMELYERCKSALDQAQLKVELLLKGASEIGARVPFDRRDHQG